MRLHCSINDMLRQESATLELTPPADDELALAL